MPTVRWSTKHQVRERHYEDATDAFYEARLRANQGYEVAWIDDTINSVTAFILVAGGFVAGMSVALLIYLLNA